MAIVLPAVASKLRAQQAVDLITAADVSQSAANAAIAAGGVAAAAGPILAANNAKALAMFAIKSLSYDHLLAAEKGRHWHNWGVRKKDRHTLVLQQVVRLLSTTGLDGTAAKVDLVSKFRLTLGQVAKQAVQAKGKADPNVIAAKALGLEIGELTERLDDFQQLGSVKMPSLGARGVYNDYDTTTNLPLPGPVPLVGFPSVRTMSYAKVVATQAELASLAASLEKLSQNDTFADYGIDKRDLQETIRFATRDLEKRKTYLEHVKSTLLTDMLAYKRMAADIVTYPLAGRGVLAVGNALVDAHARIKANMDVVDPQLFRDKNIDKMQMTITLDQLFTQGNAKRSALNANVWDGFVERPLAISDFKAAVVPAVVVGSGGFFTIGTAAWFVGASFAPWAMFGAVVAGGIAGTTSFVLANIERGGKFNEWF